MNLAIENTARNVAMTKVVFTRANPLTLSTHEFIQQEINVFNNIYTLYLKNNFSNS